MRDVDLIICKKFVIDPLKGSIFFFKKKHFNIGPKPKDLSQKKKFQKVKIWLEVK